MYKCLSFILHDGCLTTAGDVYSFRERFPNLGFPECTCCHEYDIYSQFCYVNRLLNLDNRMTDD